MNQISQVLSILQKESDYAQKTQLMEALLRIASEKRLSATDTAAIAAFVQTEVDALSPKIEQAQTYREKDAMFLYEDRLLGLLMKVYPKVEQMPQELLAKVQKLVTQVQAQRYIEESVERLFQSEAPEAQQKEAEHLIAQLSALTEEYHRGRLYGGLLHYEQQLKDLPDGVKQCFREYFRAELQRYLAQKDALDEDAKTNLEMLVDVCSFVAEEELLSLLEQTLQIECNAIRFYAVTTLLKADRTIPQDIVEALAKDLTYADMTYSTLQQYQKESAFPIEFADPVYLAQSDLYHWLTYPTELGCGPAIMEFLGKVTKKKEDYYVFRFQSDSENLDELSKNRWLIGWSNPDGGTFSNFDLYDDYAQKTPEKTLKRIQKKLL